MNDDSTNHPLSRTIYCITGLPVGLAWFVVFVPLVSTSIGLLPVGVGLILFSMTLRLATVAAAVDRWLIAEILGIAIQPATRVRGPATRGAVISDPLRDTSRWRELAHTLLRFPLGIATLGLVGVWLAFPIMAILGLALDWWDFDLVPLMLIALGLVLFASGPAIFRGLTKAQVEIARSLLGPSRLQLAEQVGVVERKRDASLEGAEAERRRIERDLHDGAQARLATVAMDLGRAKRKLEQGAETADVSSIIDGAHQDAKAAIVELRDLARGIHPAVLTDRGLDAALSDVAARCTVPVHLDVRFACRPAAHIESAAYFAVSELLTNVSRHSKARNAWVTVRGDEDELRIDVSDDGLGGVDTSLGTGVVGLHERISSIDGSLSMHSPLGGGTTALIEIPMRQAGR